MIIHLENAIRRGQTYYEWIAFFFDTNAYVDDLQLNTSEEVCSPGSDPSRARCSLMEGFAACRCECIAHVLTRRVLV